MKGSTFKRCGGCGVAVSGSARRCPECGSTNLSWGFIVDVGRAPDGKRLQRRRMGFARKEDAEAALVKLLSSVNQGTYVERRDTTLGEYLEHDWLPAVAPPRVKYSTYRDRKRVCMKYVIPVVGSVVLQELTQVHLNHLYKVLLERGRIGKEGGLSPATVHGVHRILHRALRDAVRWGYVERNVSEYADPPPTRVVQAARRRSMRTWSQDELRHFLEATGDDDYHALWLTAATTGLRRSELLGLTWADVDLVAAHVSVRQTVLRSEEGGYSPADDQKSDRSARTIHLDRATVATLREHRKDQQRRRGQVGDEWEDHDLVFADQNGHWFDPDKISKAFRSAVDALDLPRIRLHDLRHTHASLLLRAGINPKVVSERLGHSSVAFTLDTYAHVMPGMQPEAAERFASLVLPAPRPQDDAAETG